MRMMGKQKEIKENKKEGENWTGRKKQKGGKGVQEKTKYNGEIKR